MGARRKSYTPQYRKDAAHLVIDFVRTIAAVAAEIGVGEQLLGRRVAVERARMDEPPPALDINERAELGLHTRPAHGPVLLSLWLKASPRRGQEAVG